jgi:hypothetical protein
MPERLGIQLSTGNTYNNRPFIQRATNEDIAKAEKATVEAEKLNNTPVISSLAGHVRAALTAAHTAKEHDVTQRLLSCLRAREGKYDGETAALIAEQGGTDIFMMLTDTKCRALEGWLSDIMLPSGERPFAVEPTPIPSIPPELVERFETMFQQHYMQLSYEQAAMNGVPPENVTIDPEHYQEYRKAEEKNLIDMLVEQAEKDASDLERHIADELFEGGWYKTLSELIYDFSTYPTCFMEGPIYKRKPSIEWFPSLDGSVLKSKPRVVNKIVKEYDRISPFDVFPSPGSRTIQDGDLCIRKRYNRRDLEKLRGVPGYNADIINTVLQHYANGYQENFTFDTEVEDLQDRPNYRHDPEGHIDCIKFYGSVQGFKLLSWGMSSKQITDPFMDYQIICYMVGHYIIGAKLNPHPLGRRNIYSASFERKNDSVWGKSPPELMEDIQKICNSLARAICNNAAIASGPQVYQLADLIPAGQENTNIYPWKIWKFSGEKLKGLGGTQRPMEFYQPAVIAGELQILYDYYFKQGSEVTGIPAYIYGSDRVGGAGKTASGLAMLMESAGKGLRNAAKNLDEGIIAPSVEEHWLDLMLSRPDLAKGDSRVKPRGSEYLIQMAALQMRRKEYLDATNNATDMQIIGPGGRAELLRENAKALKMNPEKIVPPPEKMLSTMVDQQIQAVIQRLAQAMNVPPEQIIAMIQQPANQGQGQQQPGQPQEQNVAGGPPAGMEARQFNQ